MAAPSSAGEASAACSFSCKDACGKFATSVSEVARPRTLFVSAAVAVEVLPYLEAEAKQRQRAAAAGAALFSCGAREWKTLWGSLSKTLLRLPHKKWKPRERGTMSMLRLRMPSPPQE